MKNSIARISARVKPCLGLIVLAGLLAAGCQTPDDKIGFSDVPGVEPGTKSDTNNPANPAAAPATVAAAAPAATATSGSDSNSLFATSIDRLAIGDLIRIVFSGISDPPQPHEERIKDDGTLTLPLIGAVKADGKTSGELQKAITDAYVPDYYKRLTVTVLSDRRVYHVGGQVRSPGRQEYLGPTTVTKAIQSAGDFNDFADRRNVVLTRVDGKTIKVNCVKAAGNPALDPPVFPGDKIEVKLRGLW